MNEKIVILKKDGCFIAAKIEMSEGSSNAIYPLHMIFALGNYWVSRDRMCNVLHYLFESGILKMHPQATHVGEYVDRTDLGPSAQKLRLLRDKIS